MFGLFGLFEEGRPQGAARTIRMLESYRIVDVMMDSRAMLVGAGPRACQFGGTGLGGHRGRKKGGHGGPPLRHAVVRVDGVLADGNSWCDA